MGTMPRLLQVGSVLYQNTEEELKRFILGFRASTPMEGVKYALSLRDNSEKCLEALVERVVPEAMYEVSDRNLGFGAAHNLLMRSAFAKGAEAYVCLNPDAVLHPSCLAELLQVAVQPGTGLVEARSFPEEHPKPYHPVTGETEWCTGTALLITRAAFEGTGGFDENIFLYCEDVDLSWRTRFLGLKARVAPSALVAHWVEERPILLSRELEVRRSAAYLGAKFHSRLFRWRRALEYRRLSGTWPEIPKPPAVGADAVKVADFSHGLRFASSRW
jgi:N-acetylglucosaminyl-diphospho-decaprenol L-rhamnosyltransferase